MRYGDDDDAKWTLRYGHIPDLSNPKDVELAKVVAIKLGSDNDGVRWPAPYNQTLGSCFILQTKEREFRFVVQVRAPVCMSAHLKKCLFGR